ncbi:MAG: glutaredoxin 3 [Pseudomonadales bacterium]|nr:glutaredoxin 3 [Pseudomonadales bacterium]
MTQPQVVIYATSWCPYCAQARQLLTRKQIVFEEIDIEAAPEKRAEMIARSDRRTVPQIFVGEHHVGGNDDLHALEAAGGLDRLLSR